MRKTSYSCLLAMTPFCSLLAQDSATAKSFAISGSVDAYYRFNFSNPKKESGTVNNYTSFTNSQNSFELGMASIKVEHTIGKVGMVADLGFGKRAEDFSYNDDKTMAAVKQAYITYSPWDNVKLTAGSWATHVGYELADAYLNRNYSMSYLFSYGPFFHTGVKADVTFGKSGFMLGIANPSDLKSASFERKFLIGQYSVSTMDDKVKFYLNYQGGTFDKETKVNQVDAVITSAISDKFSIGYNGTVSNVKTKQLDGKFGSGHSWWGSALYVNVDPASWLGLTLRGEYFDDKDAVSAGAFDASIFETTLSANFRVSDHLVIIPEVRLDHASKELFTKHSGALTKKTTTGLLAAVYQF